MDVAPQIVVIEAERIERQLLVSYLTAHGLRVTGFGHGAALRAVLRRVPPDLVLLGTQPRDADGPGLLHEAHARQPQMGIIMVCATDDPMARACALDAGADDCVARPFELRELLARVRGVLRRLRPAEPASRVQMGRCLFDLDRRELLDGEVAEHLVGGEFTLLRTFAANPHRPLEPEWLAQVTAPDGSAGDSVARLVEVLRQKVERDPAHPLAIRTVAGVGYMFVPEAGWRTGATPGRAAPPAPPA